ncbi:hypothetical protein A5634_16020 [Mycobacterium asiaticum]|uniref:Transmembrane protein n=1 Tax=Mycobacterium asiaticum TaxID=1790 RepID=A0A1A3P8L8_MYCAS|nr:hypothetical protein [Mycobacterium asiaticum]OBK30506.1 hypothetical protein A5634_16020 [Mycobacterium asiaticum]
MTRHLRPGWLVALFAALLFASTWLPWLTTKDKGGGWANGIGGAHGSLELPHGFGAGQLIVLLSSTLLVAGAMVGRGLSVRAASIAALVISLLIGALMVLYYQRNVNGPVAAEYGLYIGVVAAVCALVCAVWAVAAAALGGRSGS